MFTNFQNKAMGFGVGTLVSSAQKRGCFQRGSLTQGPRDHMERNANTREKNTCWEYQHSTWKLKYLHILDMELEKHKHENILLI